MQLVDLTEFQALKDVPADKAKLWPAMAEDVKLYRERSYVGRALDADEKKRLFETLARNPCWLVARCAAVLASSTTCRGVALKNSGWKHVDFFASTSRASQSDFVLPACEYNRVDPAKHRKRWTTAGRSLTKAAALEGLRFHDLRHTATNEPA